MLLSWCIFELCKKENQQVLSELYEEVDAYPHELNYSEVVSGFRYLEGVLCETLRLHPSVPIVGRCCTKDIVLPAQDANGENYVLRKGDYALTAPYVTGRCEKIWGDDVLQFKPERWKEKGVNSYDQYTFSVFNVNPRLCLGKQFAMTEAKVWMFHFLKRYRFQRTNNEKIRIKPGPVLNMENGLSIRLEHRR